MNRAISTQELEALGLKITAREPMSRHTTWGIGGPAEWYAEPASLEQLSGLLRFARANDLPVFFLGGGSNLLVGDRGLDGFVVRLKGVFEQVEFGSSSMRAKAGVYLPTLIKQCAERGLGGAEPLVGVPGTVGGALVMNAGTRDLEIGRIVQSVEVLSESGGLDLVPSEKISFEYRKSTLGARAVCFATLRLEPGRRDLRYSNEIFSEGTRSSPPDSLSTSTDCTIRPISRSRVPAFMTSAPPTVPGTPTSGSAPPSPRSAHCLMSVGRYTPAFARMDEEPNSTCSKTPFSRTTKPSRPRSPTRRLEPPPRKKTGRSFARAKRRRPDNCSSEAGSAYHSAGPPMPQVVCRDIGSRAVIFRPSASSSCVDIARFISLGSIQRAIVFRCYKIVPAKSKRRPVQCV
jgi:UDP-N-acetylenolpyruvoylglucosamine reductase